MTSPYRLLSCVLLLVVACGDDGGSNFTLGTDTNTTSAPVTTTTTMTTGEPTSTTTTGTPTTTDDTASSTTDDTTTGPPPSNCSPYTEESECVLNGCEWAQIVGYTHGTQGCQGDIRGFCVPKDTAGGLTSVWRDDNGDIEVLQFPFTPTDLGPEWNTCDCDGPLACLCTSAALDCPERMEEFCGAITSENSCSNAAAAGQFACGWFTVSQEGPLDGACDDPPWQDVCLPGTDLNSTSCDEISLPYVEQGYCMGWTDPVYWREVDGVVEVTTICGPKPTGWTLCVADDPDQPDECKCGCKI
ncbi:hypothetical protein SAMN02745121_01879 [Nannocystis exedens]|uniref:Thaumatin family protein n=1 Tax=Nannocystis exedens TaxID=54 RepID=A0A1I1VQM0_9BACT|nr:hypothetical protein [Nannocystis exedens]PCC72762.1 hypothetical protein NAEX_05847 [Nannocystis exedens]SFD85412.1 hypothetical protein SAMN02745121_01879 [Nannocystis exedens]